MVRLSAEDLDDCMFIDADRNVLDPTVSPYVLMPDPKVHDTDRPCQLWTVTGTIPATFSPKLRWGASTKRKERATPPMHAWAAPGRSPTGSFPPRRVAARHTTDPVFSSRARYDPSLGMKSLRHTISAAQTCGMGRPRGPVFAGSQRCLGTPAGWRRRKTYLIETDR